MYYLNGLVILLFLLALLYIAAEIGFRCGSSAAKRLNEKAAAHIATIESALLGLLALLLGFAFSMAIGRYDLRRDVVLAEANDLQTTYLRAELLPEQQRDSIKERLRQYVQSRIEYLRAGSDLELQSLALDKTIELQKQLWQLAVMAVKQDSDVVRTGYFIESLNGLIDDHTRRVGAMSGHVPEVIMLLLVFIAAMSVGMTGYSSGLGGQRLIVPRSVLILLVVSTIHVIIDLDRPRRGFITISEAAMVELSESLSESAHQTPVQP